jgi:alpha-tubulin suppressor-like RCC1 family protein
MENHVFKAIGAGFGFSCSLTTAGEAYCSGYNKIGSLGTTTGTCLGQDIDPCSAVPVAVSGGYIFESFSVGAFATCGVTAGGDIYCWGPDYGPTPTPFRSALASDPSGVRFRTVSVGQYHACAISTTGDMYCRGLNNLGQLGNGTNGDLTRTQEPTMVVGGIKFRAP